MPTVWDKFIEKYHHDLIYLALPVVLEAFWHYSNDDIKTCEVVLGINS